jgi:hypothetical protein
MLKSYDNPFKNKKVKATNSKKKSKTKQKENTHS